MFQVVRGLYPECFVMSCGVRYFYVLSHAPLKFLSRCLHNAAGYQQATVQEDMSKNSVTAENLVRLTLKAHCALFL